MQHLEGKTAVVTGGGRGIGRGIALALADQGASVVIADYGASVTGDDLSREPADEVAAIIKAAGGTAYADYTDVADHKQAQALIEGAIDNFGKLDILVNVAGILRERMIFNMTEDEWDAVIRVHLKGTYNTTHFAAIHWRERKQFGRLINFSSTAGINGSAGQPNYAAAKAGLIGFTKSCANALGRYNVTANAIAPGASTRMTDRGRASHNLTLAGNAPSLTAVGTDRDPDHVAPVVVYLCSDAAANVSGRVIGASGFQISLYREPEIERQIFSDGPWDIDALFQRAPETLFKGLVSTVGGPASET
jgi:NAD(P)-dependent dehydrogenase (short-subunit alcohol dehydrogenase family)